MGKHLFNLNWKIKNLNFQTIWVSGKEPLREHYYHSNPSIKVELRNIRTMRMRVVKNSRVSFA